MDETLPTMPPKTSRPHTVTLALWGVFLLGVWNFGRAAALSQQMGLLRELTSQPNPRFRFTIALIWGLLFLGFGWTLRQKQPFTRKLLPLILILYTLYELSLTFLFAQTPLAKQAIWLNLSFYLLLTGFITWALNRTAANKYYTNKS